MKFKFEDLVIWQKSMDLGEDMNILSRAFPKDEIFRIFNSVNCRSCHLFTQS